MEDILTRVWTDFVDRTTGPMWFRLILQPLTAAVFGVRAGLANARRARADEPDDRRAMFHQALHDIGKVLVVGLLLDAVFQVLVLHTFYPGEAVVVAVLLVVVPYQIIRVVVGWIAS